MIIICRERSANRKWAQNNQLLNDLYDGPKLITKSDIFFFDFVIGLGQNWPLRSSVQQSWELGGQGHRGGGPPLLIRMILAYLLIMQGWTLTCRGRTWTVHIEILGIAFGAYIFTFEQDTYMYFMFVSQIVMNLLAFLYVRIFILIYLYCDFTHQGFDCWER